MNIDIICSRIYQDGDSSVSFAITRPVVNDDHAISYIIVHRNGLDPVRYKVVGIDEVHAIMLAVIECSRQIIYANEDAGGELLYQDSNDLGLPEIIANALSEK